MIAASKKVILPYFKQEMAEFFEARRTSNSAATWHHLERAHILSQPFALWHLETHFHMLLMAVRMRDGKEVAGQLIRLLVAAPGSWLGRYPKGNVGSARVGMFLPMPLPKDLQEIIDRSRLTS